MGRYWSQHHCQGVTDHLPRGGHGVHCAVPPSLPHPCGRGTASHMGFNVRKRGFLCIQGSSLILEYTVPLAHSERPGVCKIMAGLIPPSLNPFETRSALPQKKDLTYFDLESPCHSDFLCCLHGFNWRAFLLVQLLLTVMLGLF